MTSAMHVRALEAAEIVNMDDNGAYVASDGEVLFSVRGAEKSYAFVMSADDARHIGKELITAGWQALQRKFGAVGALSYALGRGDKA